MITVSLFDGMSCGQIALNKIGVKPIKYYASEIKSHAIKVTQTNFPDTIQLGDITKWREWNIEKPDLIMGGSPCTGFSFIGKQLRLEDPRSALFFTFVDILKHYKPKYFLLENVKMKKSDRDIISNMLSEVYKDEIVPRRLFDNGGIEPFEINSSLVSYQKRPRLYWTNIPMTYLPKDKKISFQDYKSTDYDYCKQFKVNRTPSREVMWNNGLGRNDKKKGCANVTYSDKVFCLTRKQDRAPNSGLIEFDDFCRYLTREELEMAQNVPVGYTDSISYNQAQCLLGDGWTVDVIAHILSFMKFDKDSSLI